MTDDITDIDGMGVEVPWAQWDADQLLATQWATAAGMGDVQPPAPGRYTGEERDGHRGIGYQADAELAEIHCQSEMAPIPTPRFLPEDCAEPKELWRTAYGPVAMLTRSYMGITRLGEAQRKLWSFLHFAGFHGCAVLKGKRLGEELAYVFEGPEEERLIRGDTGRIRKKTPDECAKDATNWYQALRNACRNGMVEGWAYKIPDSDEGYFILQISPMAYIVDGGVHDLLRVNHNIAPQDRGRRKALDTATAWKRKEEEEVHSYREFAFGGPYGPQHPQQDATVEPETTAAVATIPEMHVDSVDLPDNPIKFESTVETYLFTPDDDAPSLLNNYLQSYDLHSLDMVPLIEFFTEDDQYAIYEYLTTDHWTKGLASLDYDEWRHKKSRLHKRHLDAGSKIPLAHKAAQALSILPEGARKLAVMEIREKVASILIHNIRARGKYDFLVDPNQRI